LVKGLITQDEFVQMKSDYEAKIADLSNLANAVRTNRKDTERKTEEFRTMAEAVNDMIGNEKLTAEVVERLVDRITVSPDRRFEVRLRYFDEFEGVCA
jgi:methyl-accepting chemotaxis protein